MIRAVIALGCLIVVIDAADAAERDPRHLLVVSGIGGEPFYRDLFHRWAVSFLDVARDRLHMEPDRIVYLGEDPGRAPGRITASSRKREVARELREITDRSGPDDLVFLLLIGHGTARGDRILFNLPGPDLSATELARLLDELAGRRVVVVNTASASGPFVPLISGAGRVVITATASAAETQHPRFGGHFVAAFATPAADGDKDGQVSLLEAFVHSNRAVTRDYEQEQRLRTEHAVLDDNGDGEGTSAPGGSRGDGQLAARIFLSAGGVSAAGSPHSLESIAAERSLVDRVQALVRRKRELGTATYEAQLEALLVELALNRRALRKRPLP